MLKRCSSAAQIGTSINNQGRTTEDCVSEYDLRVVEEVLLEGVTGSVPFVRDDIESIISRKRRKNDFSLLVCQDVTRFTRAGQGHGQKLIYDLRAAGIQVYFVAEDLLINNEMAEMYVSFLFSAARESVKRIAYGSTSGSTSSFRDGRSPHSRVPPYGLDRMYSDDGGDRHVIRNLADGTQEQLDPKTGEVIRRFGRNDRKGVPNHYIKQKSEVPRYVPGDPKRVAVLQMMFYLHDVQGLSAGQIARRLNDAGVLSATGKDWWTGVVQNILNNPIYVGLGIRHREATGIYYNGGNGQPIPSEVDLQELANRKRPKKRKRKRDEWIEKPQPHLKDLLPPDVHNLAKRRIERLLEAEADPKPPKPNRDRHLQSRYWLKHFIFTKQGQHPMTGRQGGKKGYEIRYYAVARGAGVPKSDSVLGRRVPAEPLERAVMDVVRAVLLNKCDLLTGMTKLLEQQRLKRDQATAINSIDQDRRELTRCKKQLASLVDDIAVDDEEDDPLVGKIDAIKRKIQILQQRIEGAKPKSDVRPVNPMSNAQKLVGELHHFGENLKPEDIAGVRALLKILIDRIEVDLETKEVEIVFALPTWMAGVLSSGDGLGLDQLSAYRPSIEAHLENGVILATFHCKLEGKRTDRCFKCSRRAA
ncbi:MAG: recombinase family protein [Phycisphaeraceae bacterium]